MENHSVIRSEKEYHEIMSAIFDLMNKGEVNLNKVEIGVLRKMVKAAEVYEDEVLKLRPSVR